MVLKNELEGADSDERTLREKLNQIFSPSHFDYQFIL